MIDFFANVDARAAFNRVVDQAIGGSNVHRAATALWRVPVSPSDCKRAIKRFRYIVSLYRESLYILEVAYHLPLSLRRDAVHLVCIPGVCTDLSGKVAVTRVPRLSVGVVLFSYVPVDFLCLLVTMG